MSGNAEGPNRREFIEAVGAIGAAGAIGAIVAGCTSGMGDQYATYAWPPLLEQAPDGPGLRAGLIGGGGRWRCRR